jgi:hypothetical protein
MRPSYARRTLFPFQPRQSQPPLNRASIVIPVSLAVGPECTLCKATRLGKNIVVVY